METLNDMYSAWSNYTNYSTPTTATTTTTTEHTITASETSVGFVCVIIAVLVYGSNNVPVKKFSTGDGVFFQWVVCNGIFLVGLVVQLIQNSKFFPLVMLGGFIWTTGNLTVVPIIKTIGMGMGISLWGTVGLTTGWASGKFGWFGMDKDSISQVGLNYGGVVLSACSILLYVLVKDEISSNKRRDIEVMVKAPSEASPLLLENGSLNNQIRPGNTQLTQVSDTYSTLNDSIANQERYRNGTLIHVSDIYATPVENRNHNAEQEKSNRVCNGLTFAPAIHVQDNYEDRGATQNGLDYVFAEYCGIYLTSTTYFSIYCLVNKNYPKVNPKAILPGVTVGIMWGIATACWFVANSKLSVSISYPIVSTGPCTVASLFWGVCVFKEIRGVRNIAILVSGFIVMTAGALLAGVSR
ncbi:hypothetical protein RRG08_006860 [Elysia crispata]|uniref:Transmembrane protein 144 n=1 Tax=Elysia crispata TaxID=231223 RepID=A0AAE1B7Q9_9GAST|nr:hypothetical protein RRG08_006860 [Elysia crispata]